LRRVTKVARLRIRQTSSGVGRILKHKRVLRALGLKHPGSVVEHGDSVTIRGMIDKVKHLIEVEIIEEGTASSEAE
jgi:large subunit ribosomal protein L30